MEAQDFYIPSTDETLKLVADLGDITFLSDEKLFTRISDHDQAVLQPSLFKAVHEP
ncbi:hypothetical protein B9Z19DRAFT_1132795 [Tuber borchii]|uniref:Uncharacterized protein n=1 Tax=Tuber borchii TaxID=42251 RepID=A0A2T6ZGR3_TUBBO|nr:hypothetical protein B9Z19DRAFT_1132795 [Tuber borchii]